MKKHDKNDENENENEKTIGEDGTGRVWTGTSGINSNWTGHDWSSYESFLPFMATSFWLQKAWTETWRVINGSWNLINKFVSSSDTFEEGANRRSFGGIFYSRDVCCIAWLLPVNKRACYQPLDPSDALCHWTHLILCAIEPIWYFVPLSLILSHLEMDHQHFYQQHHRRTRTDMVGPPSTIPFEREAIPKQIQQDWANREYIEIICGSIKKISDFLNSFDSSCREKIALLNEKLTKLERKLDYLESRVSRGEWLIDRYNSWYFGHPLTAEGTPVVKFHYTCHNESHHLISGNLIHKCSV